MSYAATAHHWAHQTGKEKHAGRVFYDGDTIYSYGRHFPIARHVKTKLGTAAVLLNSADYSSSTSRHKTEVKFACSHLMTFEVPNVYAGSKREHLANYRAMLGDALRLLQKAEAARTLGAAIAANAQDKIASAQSYNREFRLGQTAADYGRMLLRAKELTLRSVKARAKTKRADKQKLLVWAKGGDVVPPRTQTALVRVKNGKVETSYGASAPLADAIEVLRAARRAKATGQPKTVDHVGDWGAAKITASGTIHVGCHTIKLSDAVAAAKLARIEA